MSELKVRTAYSIAMEEEDLESSGTTLVYLKSEADRVIAEKDAEIARLKAIRKVHIESIESICEGLKLDAKQICKTQRALWLARAMCAQESQYWGAYVRYVHLHENSFYEFINDDIFRRDNPNNDSFRMWSNRWRSVERKCRAKAEEYK